MPEAGARAVIVTRPRAQAAGLLRLLQEQGREAILFPLLEIGPLSDTTELQARLAGLSQYAMAAFVSPNAIDAAFTQLAQWPAGVAIAILGEGSRAALAAHGVTDANARIFSPGDPARSDSEHLLQALDLDALRGQRVLLVRGESGRELLADALRDAGAIVDVVAAYRRAVPTLTPQLGAELHALLARDSDWIITSSEALRGLSALAAALGPVDVANLQRQRFIVPHARIAETAQSQGLCNIELTGSGDAALLAALQSRS